MFFWLKKLIAYWLTPVAASLALLVIGLVLSRSAKRGRLGRAILTATTIALLLLCNKFFSTWLVRPLETRYPAVPEFVGSTVPAPIAACRYVAVLGGGNADTPGLSALNELSVSARARLVEAVRILRVLPKARLLVSGPASPDGSVTHATMLERSAVSLGIDPARIQRIENARDTEDESQAVKHFAGDAPVVLVTSAWHMPRSMALFRSAGVRAIPAPTDYTSQWDGRFHWRDFLWDIESLERSTVGIRERIGYVWISLRGKAG